MPLADGDTRSPLAASAPHVDGPQVRLFAALERFFQRPEQGADIAIGNFGQPLVCDRKGQDMVFELNPVMVVIRGSQMAAPQLNMIATEGIMAPIGSVPSNTMRY